ncbi:MAG: pseudouridine synthase [Candidatus Paceibacterota bacterium]
MATIKISKYLSEAGIASRRKAETLVAQGLIFINGKKNTNVAARIDPDADKVEFNGKPVQIQKQVYYLLNKPAGYTSTTEDPHAKKLITELVPGSPKVWPVGRLDKYTSGLILMTNDGQLTLKLTHPRYRIEKEYEIVSNYPLTAAEIDTIRRGVKLNDGLAKPDRFEPIGENLYRIIIHSGKKRVVRRIIEKIGKTVIDLKRVRIDFLTVNDLQTGQWRTLTSEEIRKLLK